MITVSLCMIVKDEEKVLARCLNSLADLVDEIIIVDTGSTDRTIEIAQTYTNKIFDYKWTGNFAAARNYSFSKASMDYIYCADADEVLDECNRERFCDLKKVILPEVEIVQMYYCNQLMHNTVYNYDKEYRPKLYKRVREFNWEDPVHEMVRLNPIIFDSDIEIMHLPSGGHASRDFRSFEKMTREGVPLSKRLHNMYAKELFIAGEKQDFLNAESFFYLRMEDTGCSLDEVKEACCVVARAARIRGDEGEFFKAVLKNIVSDGCAEICYEIGTYYMDRHDYQEAIIWYYNSAYETESILYEKYAQIYARQKLAECYRKLGCEEEAASVEQSIQEDNR